MAALLNDNQAVHHFIANKLSPNIELQLSSYVVRYWIDCNAGQGYIATHSHCKRI